MLKDNAGIGRLRLGKLKETPGMVGSVGRLGKLGIGRLKDKVGIGRLIVGSGGMAHLLMKTSLVLITEPQALMAAQ